LTYKVVFGLESKGIPAYGPIWDSWRNWSQFRVHIQMSQSQFWCLASFLESFFKPRSHTTRRKTRTEPFQPMGISSHHKLYFFFDIGPRHDCCAQAIFFGRRST
jgi:hypothetical protein